MMVLLSDYHECIFGIKTQRKSPPLKCLGGQGRLLLPSRKDRIMDNFRACQGTLPAARQVSGGACSM